MAPDDSNNRSRKCPPRAEGSDRELLTETLFGRIAKSDDNAEIEYLRGRVVSINMRVAESLARRYFGHGENDEDLLQVAHLGLTKATRSFHSELGHNFLSCAVPTITGEIKNISGTIAGRFVLRDESKVSNATSPCCADHGPGHPAPAAVHRDEHDNSGQMAQAIWEQLLVVGGLAPVRGP